MLCDDSWSMYCVLCSSNIQNGPAYRRLVYVFRFPGWWQHLWPSACAAPLPSRHLFRHVWSRKLAPSLAPSPHPSLPQQIFSLSSMTTQEFSAAGQAAVNLRQAAMDLARRLSSLRDFVSAANSLTACNDLPPQDVKRHCRKVGKLAAHSSFAAANLHSTVSQIVTLIEVSRLTPSCWATPALEIAN